MKKLKFLFACLGSGGPSFWRRGIARALQACGHEVHFWNYAQFPGAALDIFEQVQPDVFFGMAYPDALDRACKKAIERYKPRTILYAKTYGPSLNLYDGKETFDIADENDLRNIEEVSPYIDFLTIHHHPNVVEQTLGWYKNKGIVNKVVGIGKAFDCITYGRGEVLPSLESDLVYIGGYWGIKSPGLREYLLPLCDKYNFKIFGAGWGVSNCLGFLPEYLSASAWKSASICLNVHEPHSRRYGFDVVERPFKTIGTNGFCISDHVDALYEYFNDDEIVIRKDPRSYHNAVEHFLNNPQDRLPYIEKGQARIWKEHTYFDRASQLLNELGFTKEASHCMEIKQQYVPR